MTQIKIPRAATYPKKLIMHGDTRVDPYFWLREKDRPETLQYLNEENTYFQNQMRPLQNLKKQLFKEMKARIKENDSSVPSPYGDFFYYRKYKKGKQYSILCRKPKKGGKEEIVLDHNKLAQGQKYFHSTGYALSDDHSLLLYSADFDGSERYNLHIKDLKSGNILPDTLKNSHGSFVWASDNKTIFYTVLDKSLRPYQVYRHVLGTNPARDELVFEEKDPKHFVSVGKTSSGKYIYIYTGGSVTSEMWYVDSDQPNKTFCCFEPRKEGVLYRFEHNGASFWIRTNYRAKNFQIMKTSVEKTARKNWRTVFKHSDKILRSYIHSFAQYLIIGERQKGLPQIRVYNFKTQRHHVVEFFAAAYEIFVADDNFEFDTETLRLNYSSPVQPNSVLAYNMRTKTMTTLKTQEIKGHDPSRYKCERHWVRGHDGVKIPLTLLYRKGFKKNSAAPGYLYGYGSYGAIMSDGFPSHRDVYRLVDRGFVYALAHIRGGSEMGRHWYENGKFLKKKNTFKDFISCAEHLGKQKWIHPSRLAICGGSAGGMLMGACMNMRPDLFRLVVAHVPFVDVLNTMLDKDLPLTPMEFKEWGNPEDKKYYKYIKSYSPYDNVTKRAYPHLFVTCGLNDPRVTYWEPAKWVARLRQLKTDNNKILFKINMGMGHFGASGRFDHLYEMAEEYAFVLHVLGVEERQFVSPV